MIRLPRSAAHIKGAPGGLLGGPVEDHSLLNDIADAFT